MSQATILIDIADKNFFKANPESAPYERERLRTWQILIDEQLLAAGLRLMEEGQEPPLLLAQKNSPLLSRAAQLGLKCLPVGAPLTGFRLWRWQKKRSRLNIVAVGETSLPLACKLAKYHPPQSRKLYGLFYLPTKTRSKFFPRVDLAICLSRSAQASLMEKNLLDAVLCLPGMTTEYKIKPSQNGPRPGNFVFGMAESLASASGALNVARAMAAIWQIENLPTWEVRMFGAGHRYQPVIDEAAKLGVLSRLAILDDQPLEETAGLCDAWLAPGHSALETPIALWAGVAAELPVIATATTQHKGWLPSDNALWVEPESPQELGHRMIKIMKNSALAKDLSQKSASWKKEISLAAMMERLMKIIASK